MFKDLRNGKRIEGDLPLPPLKTWLKLYRNPKRIGRVIFQTLGNINDDSTKEVKYLELFTKSAEKTSKPSIEKLKAEWKEIPEEKRKEIFVEIIKFLDDFKNLSINNFNREIPNVVKQEIRKNLTKPELIFFMRVMVPCFALYGVYPHQLLKEGQNGNDDAIEKMIRLDKSIIFDPKISEIIHQAIVMKKQGRISMVKKAFSKTPRADANMRTIKCHLGGLISFISIKMKQKMSAVDIRNLFDAIANDQGAGAIDPDIGDMTPETFSKNIQNAREMWQHIIPERK